MIYGEFMPWNSACREHGCTWIQEEDFRNCGWWLYHKDGQGAPVNMEDRMFVSKVDVFDDYGKVQVAVLGYYDAHHARPSLGEFDEERERARLVAV